MNHERLFCSICDKPFKHKYTKKIYCDYCLNWVHPVCNEINSNELQNLAKADIPWSCLMCTKEMFPFTDDNVTSKSTIHVDENNDNFYSMTNSILAETYDDLAQVCCKYYDIDEFNTKFNNFSREFSVFHMNIASLPKHFDSLTNLLESLNHSFKVIGITETRIYKNTSSKQNLDIAGYNLISTETESTAGGTSLFLAESLNYKPRDDLSSRMYLSKLLESTFVELTFEKKTNLIIGCIYKHPGLPISEFNRLFLAPILDEINKEKKDLTFLGDFNINLLNSSVDLEVSDFIDILESHLISPTISIPTRITRTSKTLIDNILTSPNNVNLFSGNLTVGISDHLPQFLIFDNFLIKPKPLQQWYRDWNAFDRENFILDFLDIDWVSYLELNKRDPNTSFTKFFNRIDSLIDHYVPLRKITKKQKRVNNKPWLTKGIISSINHRNKIYKLFLKSKDPIAKNKFLKEYKFYRNKIVDLLNHSKTDHYKYYFENNMKNSKKVWEGINELISIKKKSVSKISLNINNTLISDPRLLAENFNNYFTTIANKIRTKIPPSSKHFTNYLKNSPRHSFFFTPVTIQEVINVIKSLNQTKSTGPSSIPNRILNTFLTDISTILVDLFNLSIETGKFPDILKVIKVIPIFKNKGSPLEVSNYRPISLLSNIDKIFEKIVHFKVTSYLKLNSVIFKRQFGFRKKHSTIHNIIALTENILNSLDNGKFSCGVFLDLQKAFDTVDHEILLSKLKYCGIRGIINDWFRSYLFNRKQFTTVLGQSSKVGQILYGVPQGSVLGPLLFLIYINDLPNSLCYTESFMFADDTALLLSDFKLKTIKKKINIDLKLISQWLNSNKIALNVIKTEAVLFRHPKKKLNYKIKLKLNGKSIYFSSHVKYLGVILDEHLNWSYHMTNLAVKLRRSNGIISKLRHSVSKNILISVYYALFHSNLTYGIQIWAQHIQKNSQISKLQKTAMRLLTFSAYNAHSKPLFEKLNILSVPDIVFFRNISLIYSTLKGITPHEIQSILNLSYTPQLHLTRNASLKLLFKHKVNTSKFGIWSIRFQSITNWNILQSHFNNIDLLSISLYKLKSLIYTFLQNKVL